MSGATKFSDRSQESFLDEFRLMEQIGDAESVKRLSERRLESLQRDRERFVKASANGDAFAQQKLGIAMREIREEEGKLTAYSEHINSLTSQIAALRQVTPEQLGERRSHQEVLLSSSRQRLSHDKQIEEVLQQLRMLLMDRNELTVKMEAEASAIGLKADLDKERVRGASFLSSRFDSALKPSMV